jgi:flagellar hook-basal body complex protein FliE
MNDVSIKPLAVGPASAAHPERQTAVPGSREGFGSILKDSLGQVNHLHHKANQAVEALAAGRSTDVHNTMIALQKADVSFRLLMQIRNKVVSAYETVMRMQI